MGLSIQGPPSQVAPTIFPMNQPTDVEFIREVYHFQEQLRVVGRVRSFASFIFGGFRHVRPISSDIFRDILGLCSGIFMDY